MTTHLCTFSDESMSRARELCIRSARHHGVDEVHEYEPSGVASAFVGYEAIWGNRRGCGLWAWKPMIINSVLGYRAGAVNTRKGHLSDGDIVIYSDAGVEFINSVSYIIERMDQDVFLFGNNWEHAHWCKRDVVEAVWPWPSLSHEQRIAAIERLEAQGDHETLAKLDTLLASDADITDPTWERFGKQCQASVIFFRVSDYSRSFVAEWLKWCLHRVRHSEGVCTDEWRYLIDDSPSIAPNHPEFRENRHDQAILTTMAYREGIKLHWWPATYNDGAFNYEKLPEYAGDDYPILFHHHRRRNHEWSNAA